ncbi:MAG: hypothetical protein QXG40_07105 [Ignisphaera sp.]
MVLELGGSEVDLEAPEAAAFIEMKDPDVYLFDRVFPWTWSLPMGIKGRVIGLILYSLYFSSCYMDDEARFKVDLLPDIDTTYMEKIVSLVKRFSSQHW